jgi:hypothetical protein
MYHALIFLLFIHQPPQTGGNNSVPPAGNLNQNQQPQGGNISSGQNAMVDGVYTILAYEKYGRPVMASNTIRVVIRNNILSFPGDAKMPGKMIQLTFGPNNTVTTTPMDGTVPLQNQNQNQTNQQVPNDPLRNNLPGSGTTPENSTRQAAGTPPVDNKVPVPFPGNNAARNAQGSATGETTRQAAGTPPLNNGQMGNNQGTGSTVPQNNNGVPNSSNTQNNNMQNYPGVESGVYVQSNEFLSICITSQGGGVGYPVQPINPPGQPVNPPGQPINPPGQPINPPGQPFPPKSPIVKDSQPGQQRGSIPPIGGQTPPGTNPGNVRNGANMNGQNNNVQGGNAGYGGPSSAVIVLRRVAN